MNIQKEQVITRIEKYDREQYTKFFGDHRDRHLAIISLTTTIKHIENEIEEITDPDRKGKLQFVRKQLKYARYDLVSDMLRYEEKE
jgi:hypothetical protein